MDHSDWLRYPETCWAAVSRNDREEACDKPAVAVGMYTGEEFEHHAFPVCKHHARGRDMLPLKDIIKIVSEEKR